MLIWRNCCLKPMSKNSVFEELIVRRLTDMQEAIRVYLKRILQARDVYIKIRRIEREKELCVICIEVMV